MDPVTRPRDEIDQHLRRMVREARARDEDVTINSVRARVEKLLDLGTDFLKRDVEWKVRSKEIIQDAFAEPTSSPEPPVSKKRKAEKVAPPKKKKKKKQNKKKAAVTDSEGEEDGDGDANDESHSAHSATDDADSVGEKKSRTAREPDVMKGVSPPPQGNGKSTAEKEDNDDDESDLSSVIDDIPPPRKKRSQKPPSTSTTRKPKPPKTNPTPKDNQNASDPSAEEIKRLQSHLLKCGVRKLWHRELAPYSASRDKIAHLRKLLVDVGMTGRFSEEKARSIKESRELQAELEAVEEFNEQWGFEEGEDGEEAGSGAEGEDGGRGRQKADVRAPGRRLKPKGLVDFGDSDDESE